MMIFRSLTLTLTLALTLAWATVGAPVASAQTGTQQADEYTEVSRLIQSNQYPLAMTKIEQFLANKPRDPQMRFLKSVIQTETGRNAEAISTLTKLTEDYPELPEPYNNLAVLYTAANQLDKARGALEMAIKTNPSYATAHENLGDLYAKLASNAYAKALQLDASNTGIAPKLAMIRELSTPTASQVKNAHTQAKASSNANAGAGNVASAPSASAGSATSAQKPHNNRSTATPSSSSAVPSTPASSTSSPLVIATNPTSSRPVVAPVKPATTVVTTSPTGSKQPSVAPPVVAHAVEGQEIESAVQAWARAWSERNMSAYFAAYGKDFVPRGQPSRAAWEEERKQRILSKNKISVKVSDVKVNLSNGGSSATVSFKQDYKGGTLSVSSRKSLKMVKTGDSWVIVKEISG